LINDVLAFTTSPWYNKKERARLIKEETNYGEETVADVSHAHA